MVFLKLLIPLVKLKYVDSFCSMLTYFMVNLVISYRDSVVFDELVCILIQRVSLFKVTTDVLGLLVILVQAHPV